MAGEAIVITPAIEKRLRSVYERHGAQAARDLAKRILGRWFSREELRNLCRMEKDEESYAQAIVAHRVAWDQAGWNARPWWK